MRQSLQPHVAQTMQEIRQNTAGNAALTQNPDRARSKTTRKQTPMITIESIAPPATFGAATPSISSFDFNRAHREGWTLADLGAARDGSPRVELRKLDKPPVGFPAFRQDQDAWAHVVARAKEGSLLHRQALDFVDPRERLAIATFHGPW